VDVHPPRGKRQRGDAMGDCGGVTRKWDIISNVMNKMINKKRITVL
jgi:anionic cell wall polymer biosynthesis LytR-Cps2A-Psr (LCP) family protein